MVPVASRIEMVPVDRIKMYGNNPRINDHVVPSLCNCIRKFGFNSPIVIDENGVIINGHTRYKAALKLGMEKIPCVYVDDLTEEEKAAYRLADNKIGELAYWDMGKVEDEMKKIGSSLNMIDFGFNPESSEAIDPGREGVQTEGGEEEGEKPIERTFTHKCPNCGHVFED